MILSSKLFNTDSLGAVVSGLCLIHCLATPFLFVAHTGAHHNRHHQGASPEWWGLIDSTFLLVSLIAVFWAVRHTSKQWMKVALPTSWLLLAGVILNEKFEVVHLAEAWIYVPALSLVVLHLYNHRNCQCADNPCCVEPSSEAS